MIEEFETKKLTPEFLKNFIASLYDLNDKIVFFPEGFFVANTTKYFNNLSGFHKTDLKKYIFIDFQTGKILNSMDYIHDPGSYYMIQERKHHMEYSQIYNDNFKISDKIKDSTGSYCSGFKSDLWEGCSPLKFGMFIVYKNQNGKELYGVIDKKRNFLVNFAEYINVELLPNYHVYLTDKNHKSYIYSLKYGLNQIDINKEIIKLEASLDAPYYIITLNDDKYGEVQGLIDKKGNILIKPIYKYIYINNENMAYGYQEKESNENHIFNAKMKKIATIDADIILFFDTYILYQKNNIIYTLNLKTKKLDYFNLAYVIDENGKQINLSELRNLTEEQLDTFISQYPYYEEELGHIILHNTKKYGIKLTSVINNKSYKRYFKSKDQLEKIETYISDMFLQNNIQNRQKTLKKGK